MMTHIATHNTTINRGGKRISLVGGKPIPKNLPSGVMKSLQNSGSIVSCEDWEKENPAEGEGDGVVSGIKAGVVGEWTSKPTIDLAIPEELKKTLVESSDGPSGNGFPTVRTILEYGAANNGLTGINGVGEKSEAKIQEAIEAIRPNS